MLISIQGIAGSGKTSLCERLRQCEGLQHLHFVDDYVSGSDVIVFVRKRPWVAYDRTHRYVGPWNRLSSSLNAEYCLLNLWFTHVTQSFIFNGNRVIDSVAWQQEFITLLNFLSAIN